MGLIGKPQLCTKFEIAIFSHCINIKGKPQSFEAPQTTATPTFVFWYNFINGLGKPKLYTKLNSLASTITEILKGTPKCCGAPVARSYTPTFFLCGIL